MIDRRKLIALLGGTILARPLEVRGQEPGSTYRIGTLQITSRDAPQHTALYDEISRLGFAEGTNLEIDGQGYGLRPEQLAPHAAKLVKARVDVIYCGGAAAFRTAQQATATIPLVGNSDDMVGEGLVVSMAHPGGNTTGGKPSRCSAVSPWPGRWSCEDSGRDAPIASHVIVLVLPRAL